MRSRGKSGQVDAQAHHERHGEVGEARGGLTATQSMAGSTRVVTVKHQWRRGYGIPARVARRGRRGSRGARPCGGDWSAAARNDGNGGDGGARVSASRRKTEGERGLARGGAGGEGRGGRGGSLSTRRLGTDGATRASDRAGRYSEEDDDPERFCKQAPGLLFFLSLRSFSLLISVLLINSAVK